MIFIWSKDFIQSVVCKLSNIQWVLKTKYWCQYYLLLNLCNTKNISHSLKDNPCSASPPIKQNFVQHQLGKYIASWFLANTFIGRCETTEQVSQFKGIKRYQ
jgi:hypothetical protein